jgi:hypothetical protein
MVLRNKVKRIFIVADVTYNPIKMFLSPLPKSVKGFIREGHDVYVFSYRTALFQESPLKSKSFAARFYKERNQEPLGL